MATLTPKEQELFGFIENYQMTNGSSPTVREMREHMGLKSDGFVVHCLKSLCNKGVLNKKSTPRGIKLLETVSEKLHSGLLKLPVLGTVPAGGPVISEETTDEWMTFDQSQIRHPNKTFILRVKGESMIGAGIFEGDFAIIDGAKEPHKGDIVCALVDGGSTLKRYEILNGRPCLKAENPAYKAIYPESEMEIQGVAVGLFRRY